MDSNLQKTGAWVSTHRENAQDHDFAPLSGDLGQSEKLSEIKPPLAFQINVYAW